MRYRFARPEGTRAPVKNVLPLQLFERIFTKRLVKMSALSALPPPPSRLLYEGRRLICVGGGCRCRQASRERNGGWLGRMPARQTLYHTLLLVSGRASRRAHRGPLGERCLNQDFQDKRIVRMTDDGPILVPWLKGQIATTQSFRMHASQWVWSRLGGDQSGRFRNPV